MDTITRRDSPRAASHAAKTRRMIGIILDRVKWVDRIVIVINTNRASTIPSRHRRADIRWERYISRPVSEIENASIIFI